MTAVTSAEATGSQADSLTTQEKLLLAQAVYKVGAVAWPVVSKLLSQHPICTSRPSEFFTPEACEAAYVGLMTSIGQNVPAADAMKPQAKVHLRLAQTFYLARLEELKAEIETYETGFTNLMNEINSIKSGDLDATIQEELRLTLARKYGKKLLDSWVPPPDSVKKAVEAGPIKEGETDPETAPLASSETIEVEEEAEQVEGAAEDGDRQSRKESSATGSPEEDMEVDESTPQPQEEDIPSTPKVSPPASDLSPPPSAPSRPADDDKLSPAPPTSPSPEEPSTRLSKRKASTQPRGAPASKRSGRGRRATSPDPQSEAASDAHDQGTAEPEPEPEPEEENTGGRGRRQSRRSKAVTQDSPAASARTKDSSPAVSRRAPSVSSTTSAPTPAHEDRKPTRRGGRGGRGMRDEVVSKNVREHSAAVESVKEEVEEEDEEGTAEEEEPRPARARRGRPPAKEERIDDDEEEETEEARPTRTKRGRPEKSEAPASEKKDREEGHATGGGRRTTRGARHTTPPQEQDGDERESEREREQESTTADITPAPSSNAPQSTAAVTGRGKTARSEIPKDAKITQRMLYGLLDSVQGHIHGSVFQNPVRKSDAPDYYDIIKRPMDLKTIRHRIRDGQIAHIDEFERDILLMFANAMMYNEEGSQVYDMAMDMLKESENHIAHYRSMQHDLGR